MATEVIHVIDPDGGTGYDYLSLNAWEAAQQRDLVTADEQETAKCRSSAGSADTTAVDVNGWTTDATHYIKIWTDPTETYRHPGYWDDTKYRSVISSGINILISIDYVHIEGLQIACGSGYADTGVEVDAYATLFTDIKIKSCIAKGGTGNAQRGFVANRIDTNSTVFVMNSIVQDFSTNSSVGILINSTASNAGTLYVYNSTVYNCITGVEETYGYMTVTNCAVFGNTDDFVGTITIDHCASDDGDGTNAVIPSDWSTVFVDITNRDFHLKSTDTDLIGAGTDDPGTGLYSDDIDGQTRTTPWDIGADEYVAATPSGVFLFKRNPDPRIKPPVGSVLNPDHPISQILQAGWILNEGGGSRVYDIVKGVSADFGPTNSPVWYAGSLDFSSSPSNSINTSVPPPSVPAAVAVGVANGATVTIRGIVHAKVGSAVDQCLLATGTAGLQFSIVPNESGSAGRQTVAQFDAGIYHNVVGLRNSLEVWVDGIKEAVEDDTNNYSGVSDNMYLIGSRSVQSYNRCFQGYLKYVYFFNSEPTPDQIAWLHAEPYCMILQPQYWYMVDFGAAGGTVEEAFLSLSQSFSLTDSGQATAEGAITLASSQGLSDGGAALAEASLSLSEILELIQSGNITTEQAISLTISKALDAQANAIAEGSLALSHNQAITIQASTVSEASLTLAKALAIVLGAEVPGFEVSLDLSQSLGLITSAEATAEATFTLAYDLALQNIGQATSEAVLSLAMSQGLTTDYIITIEGAIALAQSFGLTLTSDAIAEGQLTLSQLLAISTLAQAAAEAGINLNQVTSLTITGSTIIAGLVTPDGRTYKISVEVRTFGISAEDRTLKIE